MNLIALDFWTILLLAIGVGGMYILYLFIWRLAYSSEGMIILIARMGMPRFAKSLLATLIGYNEETYQRSRFVVWNQVHVRFFMLWSGVFFLTGLILVYQLRPIVWIVVGFAYVTYRLLTLWFSPVVPNRSAQDSSPKQFVPDVNEQVRPGRRPAQSLIRRWDYLDELFAASL
jgi:hypothetical protein